MTIDDVLQQADVGEAAISPDGRRLALTIHRPPNGPHEIFGHQFLWDAQHADVWLVSLTTGEKRNLTNGAGDGSAFWNPVWSPDGRRLAMLSTKGGDNVRLYVFDIGRNRLTRVHDAGLDLDAELTVERVQPEGIPRFDPFRWVDSHTLLLATLPPGDVPTSFEVEVRTSRLAPPGWARSRAGHEPSVSVLNAREDSGHAVRGSLVRVDLATGHATTVLDHAIRYLYVSTDGRSAAATVVDRLLPPDSGRALTLADFASRRPGRLAVLDLAEPRPDGVQWVPGIVGYGSQGAPASIAGWAPNHRQFAVIAHAPDDPVGRRVFVISVGRTDVRAATPDTLIANAVAWDSAGVLYARLGHAFTGKYTWGRSEAVRDAHWYRVANTEGAAPLVRVDDTLPALRRVEDTSSSPHAAAVASRPGSRPLAYDSATRLTVFATDDSTGTTVAMVRGTGTSQPTTLVMLNTWRPTIDLGQSRWIRYRGADGDSLNARIILPPGYRPGVRYPTVLWVYAGYVLSDTVKRALPSYVPERGGVLDLRLIAAHGYVVLEPSMPLPEKPPVDPYLELPKGVMPAIDRLVELGIADPARLAVMGQSYGGFSTYGLITQTTRFKAAVALAGLSDFVSLYGIFDARERYGDTPHLELFQPWLFETGQVLLGATPWQNWDAYVRNSPLFYFSRVTTPLLIIQGDQDYVSMTQGEEAFTALERMGKPARFARYWGEGHVFESPANLRDMWHQVFTWLDQYMGAGGSHETK